VVSSSTTGISGDKNPEKIPLHVAAFSWFDIAATNMNDGEHPYRFAQDISNTRLSEVDQGVLKAAVSDFYLNYAPLLAAYRAKASTGKATGDDTRAFNKPKYQLALDEYEKHYSRCRPRARNNSLVILRAGNIACPSTPGRAVN
jgi:hypothetical protein